MPFDLESSILLWLNKMNSHNMLHHLRKKSVARDPETSKIRIRKDQVVEARVLPQQKTLTQALRNGVSLLSLVLYYFGDALNVEGMHFKACLHVPILSADFLGQYAFHENTVEQLLQC